MSGVFDGFKPERVYRFFEEVAHVPRNSFHEQKISDWLVNFARERGIACVQDKNWNVVMTVPATPGYENRKKIILQGHMDMVCVADPDVEHDFENDPIELVRDGDFVRAAGTTLGADDGNALALMLAVLDDTSLPHPQLQCVFTAAEEVGMIGAANLDGELLDGEYLIGLDYSQNTSILVSGAGSCEAEIIVRKDLVPRGECEESVSEKERKGYRIEISGLKGGHSGVAIIYGRACALRLLGEVMSTLMKEFPDMGVTSMCGGEKGNSIAMRSQAVVAVRKGDSERFEERIRALNDTLRAEFETVDPGVTVEAVPCELPKEECLRSSVGNLVALLDLLPSGTQSYLDADRTLVKSSVNFGTLRDEVDCFVLRPFFRSNTEYQLDQLARRIETLCRSFSCECRFFNRSPAWQFDPHSSLNAKVQDIWEKTRGYRPPLAIVHGGVEPGLFIEKMARRGRKLEAVNVGVHNYDVHSTRERMEIATLGQAFELLAALLRDLD